jgi:hypothetical protein
MIHAAPGQGQASASNRAPVNRLAEHFLLELAPMTTFVRVRLARARGAPLPPFSIDCCRRVNAVELGLVVAIVFVAAFMARGAWLF